MEIAQLILSGLSFLLVLGVSLAVVYIVKPFKDLPKTAREYVELSKEKFELEKNKAVKQTEEQVKSRMQANAEVVVNEWKALIDVMIELTYGFAQHPYFEVAVKGMKDSVSKERLLATLNEQKEKLKALYPMRSAFMRDLLMSNPWMLEEALKVSKEKG